MFIIDVFYKIAFLISPMVTQVARESFFSSMNCDMPIHLSETFLNLITKWASKFTRSKPNWFGLQKQG